ncbi:MAG TPA: AbrB family transcriptional regulator, partial [Firmicutes bacterium]|nr:AbrB family transcriptional regulator [Bacillota bacterium]
RDIFNIKPGDTLLLLADKERGIAIVRNEEFIQFANAIFAAQGKPEEEQE